MTSLVGCLLLLGIIVGGIYLYLKVERLDQEIAKQRKSSTDNDQN